MAPTADRRDWVLANEKRDWESGRCVVCRAPHAELAHIIRRVHDKDEPLKHPLWSTELELDVEWVPYRVWPTRVTLLCGPATDTHTCHGKYDHGQLDLLPFLTMDEQLQAVADAGGLAPAFRRVTGGKDPDIYVPRASTPTVRSLP